MLGPVQRTHCIALAVLAALLLLLQARLPPEPCSLHHTSLRTVPFTTPRSMPAPAPAANRTAPPRAPPATPRRHPRVVLVRDVYEAGHSRPHPELCPALGARLRLLVLVSSAPSNVAARDAVRLTWGHYRVRADVAVAFVLGASPPELRAAIDAEDALYGDMIEGRSHDSYSNLTLKTLSMLDWADRYCPRAPRLLKTDDDMFINIPRLLQFAAAPSRVNATRTIWGRALRRMHSTRATKSKYYVSPLQFPGRVFPDYVSGTAYLMTGDCVRELLAAAPAERYVGLEDVFVTGVLAARLHVALTDVPQFYYRPHVAMHPCTVQRRFSIHAVLYHEQFDLWRKLLDGKTKCVGPSGAPL